MKKSLFSLVLLVALCLNLFSQQKKVAVVTFGVNKHVSTDRFGANAALAGTIAMMAKDSNFNLKPVLVKFGNLFFTEYSKSFPFELMAEDQVIGNNAYKSYRTFDTSGFYYQNCLLRPGYNLLTVASTYKKDLNQMIAAFPGIDGFMFVDLSFEISPKVVIGGMGSAGVSAFASIKIWNKNGEKVVQVWEYSMSDGTVPVVGNFPIVKPKDILPLCQDAADRLMEDLKDKLPKIIKKCEKKL
jgi:hypothetical protein